MTKHPVVLRLFIFKNKNTTLLFFGLLVQAQTPENTPLSIGDKLTIKLTLKTHKPLEYVHLKDMRPATCEPVDVVSERYWNCYKTTRDVSTNFFFDYISVGEHVLTYEVTVQQRGDFSSGVASVQCMYVPSVTAYTEGGV